MFLVAGIVMASWVSRLPAVRDSLGIRVDQVGILLLAMAIGSIVGLTFSSHIIARLGARRTIVISYFVIAVGIATTGIGASLSNFALTFGGLVFTGVAMGISDVSINVSGAANERALQKSIMPIFHAFFSFGTMLGAAVGYLAESAGVPIVIHLGAIAVITAASTIAVRFAQSEHVIEPGGEAVPHDDHSKTWRGRLSIWRDPRTLLIGVLVLAAAFAEGSANDWVAIAMVDSHGASNATGALVFGVFVTAMTIGRLGGVFLLNRFGRVIVLRASFLLASLGLVVFIFVPDPTLAAAGVIAWGLGAALGFPVGMSAAADDPKTAAARVSAVATIGYFAFLVGPPLIGYLGQQVGLLTALLVVLGLCAIGAVVAGAAKEPSRT
jgi:predicted MFS family arabinose efflux permease